MHRLFGYGLHGGAEYHRIVEAVIGQLYRYPWANNSKRATLYGRIFRVLARGAMNSVKVRFEDDGQIEIISRNALRKVKA